MKILVGVSGSIGVLNIHSYLISLRSEPEVDELRVVMTPTAARFVNPQGLEALLRLRVHVDPWSDPRPMLPPPELVQGIDLYLIAPASASTLSRCAAGAADTLLANCYLNCTGPVAFAPAMAPEMWEHPAVRQNVARLESFGAHILPMGKGWSAAAGKVIEGSLCPYKQMWPLLKSLVKRPAPEAPEAPEAGVDSAPAPHPARS